jgi:hypothetical protein
MYSSPSSPVLRNVKRYALFPFIVSVVYNQQRRKPGGMEGNPFGSIGIGMSKFKRINFARYFRGV